MASITDIDIDQLEKRLCVLEAAAHAAVKELEQERNLDSVAFGLHFTVQEFREQFEKAIRQMPKHS